MTAIKFSKDLDMRATNELEHELGENYQDIIEMEWDCSVEQFILWFWNEEECGFDI